MPILQQSKAFGDLQGLIFSYVSDIRLLIGLKLRNGEIRPPDRSEPVVQAVILLSNTVVMTVPAHKLP